MRVTQGEQHDEHVRFEVTIEPDEVRGLMQNVYLVLACQSGIKPQKDRTSQALVVETLGEECVADYVSRVVMNRALPRALDERLLDVIGIPECRCVSSVEEGSAFTFEVHAVQKPLLLLRSYDPIKLDGVQEDVGDEEIDVFLGELFASRCDEDDDPPPLDDAWVSKNIQGCSTVEALRNRIRSDLEKRSAQEHYAYCCYRTAAQLSERLEGNLPDAVFEARYAQMLQDFRRSLDEQDLSEDTYFESQHVASQDFKVRLMSQTREQLRQELALDALARHLGMKLDGDDMKAYYHAAMPGKEELMKARIENSGGLRAAQESALRLKANTWLVDHALHLGQDKV